MSNHPRVTALRRHAEEVAQEQSGRSPEDLEALTPEQAGRMLHELRVHQIELEMQNEELRRAQTELDEVRARFFDLYDLAPVGYCTISEQGLILEANLTAATLLGVTRGTLAGRLLTHFIITDDQDVYYLHRKRLLETGAPQTCELRMVRGGGTEFWAGLEATAARDAGGNPTCRVVMSDITARKRAGEGLRRSEEKYRELVESVSDVIFEIDARGNLVYVSPAVRQVLGYEPETTLGRAFLEFVYPEDRDLLMRRFSELGQGIESPLDYRFLTSMGEVRWVRTRTKPTLVGGVFSGARGTLVDITERKRAEAALRESENKYRLVVDNAGEMILVLQDGMLRLVNPSLVAGLGFSEQELKSTPFQSFIHADDRAMVADRHQKRMQGEAVPTRYEFRVLAKDGSARRVEANVVAIEWEGRPATLGLLGDITARMLAEEENSRLEAQLVQAQKMEAVGRLAGGVAHDFNNILQALLSLATVLRLRASSPELTRTVHEIEALIKRGAGLTQQLLLFSRRQVATRAHLDLGEMASAAGLLLRRLIPENIRLSVEIPPEPVWVVGDAGQLQQVLMNLAVNARDAMPHGGTLVLRTTSAGDDAVIDVVDSGHGMDEATRAHLFEPFFTTKEIGRGTGLGLAVVHGVVSQHLGRVEVESSPGAGSRFRVLLPRAPAPEAQAATEPSEASAVPRGHGEWVLVVEDEEGTRRGLAELLDLLGYRVTAVASGEEADALPEDLAPDLLLSDLMLPGMPGSELAEHLRRRWPGLKVMLMSGYTEDEALRREVDEGKVRFLQKPFDILSLARTLREALGG